MPLFLLLSLAVLCQSSTIQADRRCLGNFIFSVSRCVPCKLGQIARNNTCVSAQPLAPEKPASSAQLNSMQANSKNQDVCQEIVGADCKKCNPNFEIIMGKCIDKKCKVYSQLLGKCLDEGTGADFQALTQHQLKSQILDATVNDSRIYTVGFPIIEEAVTVSTRDQAIQISSKLTALLLQPKQWQFTGANSPKIYVKIPECLSSSNNICQKCPEGSILNTLLNACMPVLSINLAGN